MTDNSKCGERLKSAPQNKSDASRPQERQPRAWAVSLLAGLILTMAGGCSFSSNSEPSDPEAQKHAIETYAKSYGTDYDDRINAVVPMDDGGLLLLGARQTDPTAAPYRASVGWACRTDLFGDSPKGVQVGNMMADRSDQRISDIFSLLPQADGSTIVFGQALNEREEPFLWRAVLDSKGQVRKFNAYEDTAVVAVAKAFPLRNGGHALALYTGSIPKTIRLDDFSLCAFDGDGTKKECFQSKIENWYDDEGSSILIHQIDGSYVLILLEDYHFSGDSSAIHFLQIAGDGTVDAHYSAPLTFGSVPQDIDDATSILHYGFQEQFGGPYFEHVGATMLEDGRPALFGTLYRGPSEFNAMVIVAHPEPPDVLSLDIHEYCFPVGLDYCIDQFRCLAASEADNRLVIAGITRDESRLPVNCDMEKERVVLAGWVAALDELFNARWTTTTPDIGGITSIEAATDGEWIAHGSGWLCGDGSSQTFSARIAADGTYLGGQSSAARPLPGYLLASDSNGSIALASRNWGGEIQILDANDMLHQVGVDKNALEAYADFNLRYLPDYVTELVEGKLPPAAATSDGWLVAAYVHSQTSALLKLDPVGNVIWTLPGGPPFAEDEFYAGARDGAGVVAAGRSRLRNQTSATLTRWDASSTLTFSAAYGRVGTNVAYAVQPLSTGGYVLAGSTNAFGRGGTDALVFVVHADGSVAWTRAIGGQGKDVANAVVERPDLGGYLVAGTSDSRAP